MPLHMFLKMRVERRAFLREHSDVGTFVDQHIAAGAYSQRLAQIYENYFGHDKWVEGYLYIYSRLVTICVTEQYSILSYFSKLSLTGRQWRVSILWRLKFLPHPGLWEGDLLLLLLFLLFLSFALNLVTILVVHNVIIICIELVVFREDEEFLISTLGLLGRYLQQHNICRESYQNGKLLSRVIEHLYHFEHLWKSLNWVV